MFHFSVPFALRSQRSINSSESQETQPFTKLSIKLKEGQTKHKRPILFIVPARASQHLSYTIHGKNKDLFGLKEETDGIFALYYLKKVKISDNTVIHHVIRIIGEKPRQTRNHHHKKVLNMKVKILVSRNS